MNLSGWRSGQVYDVKIVTSPPASNAAFGRGVPSVARCIERTINEYCLEAQVSLYFLHLDDIGCFLQCGDQDQLERYIIDVNSLINDHKGMFR